VSEAPGFFLALETCDGSTTMLGPKRNALCVASLIGLVAMLASARVRADSGGDRILVVEARSFRRLVVVP